MLGWPGPEYRSPRRHAEECEQARKWLDVPFIVDGVMIQVDDVDAHCERACAAGATILREPKTEPYGRLTTRPIPRAPLIPFRRLEGWRGRLRRARRAGSSRRSCR